MVGIVSYGAYIPKFRIDRKIIYQAMGWFDGGTYQPGEKAVANFDEDSISMAVNSTYDCLTDIDSKAMDALFFATTTAPYKERLNSEIIATACDLRNDIRSADYSNSVKAGSTALLAAIDSVKAGSAKNVVVAAADCRVAKPGSSQEEFFGDSAASLVIGEDNIIANFVGSHSVSYDFPDCWKSSTDQYHRQWEDRFIRTEAYSKFILEAISGLVKKTELDINSVSKVAFPCLYPGDFKKIGKMLGLGLEKLQDPMIANVGYTGASNSLMLLTAALEGAKPGDKIIVASFGSGSDALLFEVTEEIEKIKGNRRGTKKHLAAKKALTSYEKMLAFRDILPIEKGIRGETAGTFTSFSTAWRERKLVMALYGSKCQACGTPQIPAQRICVNPDCGTVDQMEPYKFTGKKATIFTYTGDNLAYTPSPPAIYCIADFEGGGRYWFDITDVDLDAVEVGMEIEPTFRMKYKDDKLGMHIYFWKMQPIMQ